MMVFNLRQYTFPIVECQGKVCRICHLIGNLEVAPLENGEVQANTAFLAYRSYLGRELLPADGVQGIPSDRATQSEKPERQGSALRRHRTPSRE
jgi:hypothetical protein